MSKAKKTPITKYGIQIVKPWSTAMYDHNDSVATTMNVHLDAALTRCITCEPIMEDKLRELAHAICGYKFGEGYSLGDIHAAAEQELLNMQNFRLHEEYSYLYFKGLVPQLEKGMIGYGWEKCTYWKENS